jgi:REP element-mobilizing transposase RayT
MGAFGAAVSRTWLLYPFRIATWVVLPEHLHAVWTPPEADAAFSLRWTLIKRWFSAEIPKGEHRSASRAAKGSAASGSVASGSTRCTRPRISRATSIMCIAIR